MQVFYRSLRLAIHLIVGLVLAAAVKLDRLRWLSAQKLMSWWCSIALDILCIQLTVRGTVHEGACMTVANHVSWLDIIIIGACEPARFVAKSEVRDWPVAGWLADACGTFYIRRGKGGARPLLDQIVPCLQAGGCVCVFPEGTTTDGTGVRAFHPRLFAAAIESATPVQPAALRYGRGRNGEAIAPFVGDDDLLSHVLRVLQEPSLLAEITWCELLATGGMGREELAAATRAEILHAIHDIAPSATDIPVEHALAA